MIGDFATWAGLALTFVGTMLAVFSDLQTRRERSFLALLSCLLVLLIYLSLSAWQTGRATDEARQDVQTLLRTNGPMTLEMIYARISPRRDLQTLTRALDEALHAQAIRAARVQGTLPDNTLVDLRLYLLSSP